MAMSQHYFHTALQGEPITVLMGWDRPLSQFFLIVERQSPGPGQDDYIYVSDMDPAARAHTPSDYAIKLEQLGITLPATMLQQVTQDWLTFGANRIVTHDGCGGFDSVELLA